MRGVGPSEMCLTERFFAYASINLDEIEEAKKNRDLILSMGMILEPKATRAILRQIELEEELSDEDRKAIEEEKTKLGAEGIIKSDPEVQNLIRQYKKKGENSYYMGRQKVPVESLSDMIEREEGEDDAAE